MTPDAVGMTPNAVGMIQGSASEQTPAAAWAALTLGIVLDADTILAAGHAGREMPEHARLAFGTPGERIGALRSYCWRTEACDDAPWHFLAVLRAPHVVGLQGLPITLITDDDAAVALPHIARFELDAAALIALLRREGADVAAIFDFLHTELAAATDGTAPARRGRTGRFLEEFLDAIAVHDGFIEILGRPECGGLLLQGWAMHIAAGARLVGIDAGGLAFYAGEAATFERSDLLATASGLVVFVKAAGALDIRAARRVFFPANGAYYRLDVVEQKIILGDKDAVAHVKDMLDRLDGPPPVLRALKRVCRSRFAGFETVSTLPVPVRLGLDLVVPAPGAGIFVNGWLLDPRRLVRMVLLKSTHNDCQRLDESWARLARADVSAAFASDPLFAGHLRPADHAHGFLAFVARPQPLTAGESHYLELVLEDESCAFVPLCCSEGEPRALLRRILGLVSLDDPQIGAIVADHLGPIAGALAAGKEMRAQTVLTSRCGRHIERPAVSVIVPLPAGWQDFDASLARLAGDRDFHASEIVVVTENGQAEQIAHRLDRYAAFYGVCARLVVGDGPLDAFGALELGADAALAELLLFLSPRVVAPANGWLSRLVEALGERGDCAAVMPTLLYEDDSVRFAATTRADADTAGADGTAADGTSAGAPLAPAFHGYPRHWLAGARAQAVTGGTIECCLIRKRAFAALGGFSHAFMAAELRNLDFGLRLSAGGGEQRWLPDVVLYAVDDAEAAADEYWVRVRRLVDQWAFAKRWPATTAGDCRAVVR